LQKIAEAGSANRAEPIHCWVREVALTSPALPAVSDDVHTLNYADLETRANALAHHLRFLGVKPGTRVGLCHERSTVSVVGALATLKAGGAYVGLDPAYPDARLLYMLRDAEALVLLTQSSEVARFASADVAVIDLDSFVPPPGDAGQPPDDLATIDDVAYVIYTSGSTGEPKGVQVSHRNLLNLVNWHHGAFGVDETDRASVLASPAFDASVWEMWPYLTAGASLHVPSVARTEPRSLRDWLLDAGITIAFVPTPMAECLLDLSWPSGGALRFMLTGGDVLHRRPSPNTPFALVNNYGVTEATVVSTSGLVSPNPGERVAPSIGRAIAGVRLYVLDEHGRPVEPGEAGELFIGGDGVAVGYLNRPAESATRFFVNSSSSEVDETRLYRTGDLVRMGLDGEAHFLGRLDTQVQIRGQRVEPDEVAAALSTHPKVQQCVVAAHEDGYGDTRLVAYVVTTNAVMPDRDVLQEHLAAWLPRYMIPATFIEMDTLPVTANGKLDRNALPSPGRRVVDSGSRSAKSASVEGVIIAILEELLELESVDRDDNFFELGGHSLMGAQVVARLEDCFDLEVDLLTIFDHPTAAEIARVIEQDLEDDEGIEHPRSGAPDIPLVRR
jgi:amino acid adenylation domain-containing protein